MSEIILISKNYLLYHCGNITALAVRRKSKVLATSKVPNRGATEEEEGSGISTVSAKGLPSYTSNSFKTAIGKPGNKPD